MDKIKEKLLRDFKKASKDRKEKLAIKFGFKTSSDYLAYLEGLYEEGKEISKTPVVIHNVTLLDATGSMRGSKYNNSKKGILKELSEFVSTEDYAVNHRVFEFIDSKKGIKEYKEGFFYGAAGHDTPLWWATMQIIDKFKDIPKEEKILIKVYTDGANNAMNFHRENCSNLIKKVQSENFTVTFVGTKRDLNDIVRALDLDSTNTLEISDDGEGFEKAFELALEATARYASKAAKGEDVSTGFYLEIV
jgi:hypothetical protein